MRRSAVPRRAADPRPDQLSPSDRALLHWLADLGFHDHVREEIRGAKRHPGESWATPWVHAACAEHGVTPGEYVDSLVSVDDAGVVFERRERAGAVPPCLPFDHVDLLRGVLTVSRIAELGRCRSSWGNARVDDDGPPAFLRDGFDRICRNVGFIPDWRELLGIGDPDREIGPATTREDYRDWLSQQELESAIAAAKERQEDALEALRSLVPELPRVVCCEDEEHLPYVMRRRADEERDRLETAIACAESGDVEAARDFGGCDLDGFRPGAFEEALDDLAEAQREQEIAETKLRELLARKHADAAPAVRAPRARVCRMCAPRPRSPRHVAPATTGGVDPPTATGAPAPPSALPPSGGAL